jgi:hypothetical protein
MELRKSSVHSPDISLALVCSHASSARPARLRTRQPTQPSPPGRGWREASAASAAAMAAAVAAAVASGGGGFLRAWRRGAEAPGPPFSLVEFLVEFMEDFCRGRISKHPSRIA